MGKLDDFDVRHLRGLPKRVKQRQDGREILYMGTTKLIGSRYCKRRQRWIITVFDPHDPKRPRMRYFAKTVEQATWFLLKFYQFFEL